MLSKLTRGNQVTIPKAIVQRLGLKVGSDYLDVEYLDGIICLKPVDVEERVPAESWERFKKAALKKEKQDVDLTAKQAREFLSRRAKKSNQ